MFKLIEEVFEPILEKLTLKHLLVILAVCWFLFCGTIMFALWSVPAYLEYLQEQDMRTAVRWAETHRVIQLELGENVDLNEYLLIQKMEDTDLESYEKHVGE